MNDVTRLVNPSIGGEEEDRHHHIQEDRQHQSQQEIQGTRICPPVVPEPIPSEPPQPVIPTTSTGTGACSTQRKKYMGLLNFQKNGALVID